MEKLPEVSEDIEYVLYKDTKSKDFIKTVDSLMKFWAEFDKEQPGLSKILSKELIKFKKSGEKSAFLQAAWIVYRSLQVQLEVDNLNKDWEL